jgi:hypothetical protein
VPLTNSAWQKNFRLQAATTGGNPVRKGETGTHIAILRSNLQAVGFERSLEKMDFYGASTAGMIRDFRIMYDVPGSSDLADKAVLELLDAILNGKVAKRRFKVATAASVSSKGKDFAVRYFSTTQAWIEKALNTCRSVEQAMKAAMNSKTEPDFPSAVYQPFMQHFRLLICLKACEDAAKNRLRDNVMLAYNGWDDTAKCSRIGEVISKINMVTNVFAGMKTYLATDLDKIFFNGTATDRALASCNINTKKITFYENNFFEATAGVPGGLDRRWAPWVTIHEAAHAILQVLSLHGDPAGPADNPYSWHDTYYEMTWKLAPRNPDAYSHFAYQVAAGKQNLGTWG